MAPEALHTGYDPSPPSDIFSFGCIALHTYTQEFPKATRPPTYIDQSKNILIPLTEIERRKQYIDKLQDNAAVKKVILDLIKFCLNNNMHERPSSTKINDDLEKALSHKFKVATAGICAAPHLQFYERYIFLYNVF